MSSTKELLDQIVSLPVEQRTSFVDSILKSLNTPNDEIDKQWIDVAKRRLEDLRSGKVQTIPGSKVFEKIKERFEN